MVDSATRYFDTDHLLPDIGRHTVRGSAVTLVSHGLKFVVGIVGTAILARLLTPQDYGLIGMVAVATNFVAMLNHLGLSYPTVQRAEIDFNQIKLQLMKMPLYYPADIGMQHLPNNEVLSWLYHQCSAFTCSFNAFL